MQEKVGHTWLAASAVLTSDRSNPKKPWRLHSVRERTTATDRETSTRFGNENGVTDLKEDEEEREEVATTQVSSPEGDLTRGHRPHRHAEDHLISSRHDEMSTRTSPASHISVLHHHDGRPGIGHQQARFGRLHRQLANDRARSQGADRVHHHESNAGFLLTLTRDSPAPYERVAVDLLQSAQSSGHVALIAGAVSLVAVVHDLGRTMAAREGDRCPRQDLRRTSTTRGAAGGERRRLIPTTIDVKNVLMLLDHRKLVIERD